MLSLLLDSVGPHGRPHPPADALVTVHAPIGRTVMTDEKRIDADQAEYRSFTSDLITGVALGAGGKIGIDAVAQAEQTLGKLVDKVKPKPKDE